VDPASVLGTGSHLRPYRLARPRMSSRWMTGMPSAAMACSTPRRDGRGRGTSTFRPGLTRSTLGWSPIFAHPPPALMKAAGTPLLFPARLAAGTLALSSARPAAGTPAVSADGSAAATPKSSMRLATAASSSATVMPVNEALRGSSAIFVKVPPSFRKTVSWFVPGPTTGAALSTMMSGGDLKNLLMIQAEKVVDDTKREQEAAVEALGMVSEAYTVILILGPVLALVMSVIMMLLLPSMEPMMKLLQFALLMMVPVGYVVFTIMTSAIKPNL